jgi:hypothetical protein
MFKIPGSTTWMNSIEDLGDHVHPSTKVEVMDMKACRRAKSNQRGEHLGLISYQAACQKYSC